MSTRIGLISDTHMPERWPELPPGVRQSLAEVRLILHAGDVGELWVLDRLGDIAPVIAVHGNDDSKAAQRELPYQELISVSGVRILLCHSHQPSREAELASRRSGDWEPKLSLRAARANRCGARVYVFGHTHVPMCIEVDGVHLVNPGAIASGNAITRQTVQSVAVLSISDGGHCSVTHSRVDNEPGGIPDVKWDIGFRAAAAQVSEVMASPEVEHALQQARSDGFQDLDGLHEVVLRVARRCWSGENERLEAHHLLHEAEESRILTGEATSQLAALLGR